MQHDPVAVKERQAEAQSVFCAQTAERHKRERRLNAAPLAEALAQAVLCAQQPNETQYGMEQRLQKLAIEYLKAVKGEE